jgi:hypothetical protein
MAIAVKMHRNSGRDLVGAEDYRERMGWPHLLNDV